MTDAVIIAAIVGIPATIGALSAAYVAVKGAKKDVQDRVEAKVDNNTTITTQTRDMADGRLTEVTKQLSDSKDNVARLVNEGVTKASADLLRKAQDAAVEIQNKATVTATELLAQARREAAELLAGAQRNRQGDDPPQRGRNR